MWKLKKIPITKGKYTLQKCWATHIIWDIIHVNACTFKGVGCSVTAEKFFELSSSKFNILPSRNNES